MAVEPEGLCDAEAGGAAGEPHPDGGRDGGPAPDLEREAGYGAAGSPSDLGGDAVGGGAGLPGGQPGRGGHRRGAAPERRPAPASPGVAVCEGWWSDRDAIEAAYRRSDLFERRRALMERWAAFLNGPTPK